MALMISVKLYLLVGVPSRSGQTHAGAAAAGADVAEREGLLWAGLWRLSQNRLVPTVFCVDSQTTAGQAMGTLGVTEPDLSYRLLRAVSQTLQHGLPPEHLHVHHVRAHAGDPYNELVDYAAKQESQRSFNLPRMSINVQDCLDLGHVRDDHSAVGLQSAWNTVTQLSVPPKRKTQVHWRDQKIRESLHKII